MANQKGGVGKTTTTINLSACLALLGRRVLLMDLDLAGQRHEGLGLEKVEGASAYRPLLGEGNLFDKIKPTAFQGLEIIPSEVDLCGAEIEIARAEDHLQRLARLMRPVADSGRFDFIMIDCPPSLGLLTLNAFAASDYLVIPLQCEYFALEGISMSHKVLGQVKQSGINPRLELLGVVMTMFDGRTRLSAQVVDEVRQHFGDVVFDTVIRQGRRDLPKLQVLEKPIIHHDKYSPGAAAYEVLAGELLKRIKA